MILVSAIHVAISHSYDGTHMQTSQGRMFDKKTARLLPHICPRTRFWRITMVNTGIEVTRAQIGNK